MKTIFELEGESLQPVDYENLLVVDGLNFAFRFKRQGLQEFAADYLRTIDSFAKSYGAKRVLILTDKGSSAFRKDVSDNYKAGRKVLRDNQTEEEKEEFLKFFESYERALELCATRYDVVGFKGVEADDLAAYITKYHSHNYEHTWLISSDGDWDLLLSDYISRFSFVTRKEYTVGNFYENHGCDDPEQFISLKVLQGDSGDSIDGIPGIGAKRAYNLIREFGDAYSLYDAIPLDGNQKIVQNINSSGDLILDNYQLVDLVSFCEEAIAFPDNDNIKKLQEILDNEG